MSEEKFEFELSDEMKFQRDNFCLEPAEDPDDRPEFHSVETDTTIYDNWDLDISELETKS